MTMLSARCFDAAGCKQHPKKLRCLVIVCRSAGGYMEALHHTGPACMVVYLQGDTVGKTSQAYLRLLCIVCSRYQGLCPTFHTCLARRSEYICTSMLSIEFMAYALVWSYKQRQHQLCSRCCSQIYIQDPLRPLPLYAVICANHAQRVNAQPA